VLPLFRSMTRLHGRFLVRAAFGLLQEINNAALHDLSARCPSDALVSVCTGSGSTAAWLLDGRAATNRKEAVPAGGLRMGKVPTNRPAGDRLAQMPDHNYSRARVVDVRPYRLGRRHRLRHGGRLPLLRRAGYARTYR